jgi:hypothetical protein
MLLRTYLVIRLQEISTGFVQAERSCVGNAKKTNLNTAGKAKHWMALAAAFTSLFVEIV